MNRIVAPTLACLAALLPAMAIAKPATLTIPGGRLHIGQNATQTVLSGIVRGKSFRVTLPAEDGIYGQSFDSAEMLGHVGDGVVVLSTSYLSRPNNPMGACGAGTETMIRVIVLRPQVRQSFKTLTASCWSSIEDNAIDWDAATATLTTNLTTSDGDVTTRYKVAPDGKATMIGKPEKTQD